MASQEWGYDAHNGPDLWSKQFPLANGNHQSPIDIKTKEAKYDSSLKPLSISYDPTTAKTISNTGHYFQVHYDDKDNRSVLKGGPLTGNYRLNQFHVHWGSSDDGSEHTVDGARQAAELHVVHWNSDKYSSCAEAENHPDGWAIVTSLLQIGADNPNLQKVIDVLDSIKTKGKQAQFTDFDPSTLFPASHDYWTYHGSQTHPPCHECVAWIIFKDPVPVSSRQLAKFRSLRASGARQKAHPILSNNRPTQPLKGRKVKASFH
ncbi:carbonic anhydrase 1 [Microcaecilia unicolor]|uniref:Carbonic anhydrase 1 n=1 Tax=Microcaecilia unicolor TaxID=1415580 RepID=A0A6P7YXZ3_9AMPH|nr:carbonic anhydrase 1-like [Microcaecilia unicolor]